MDLEETIEKIPKKGMIIGVIIGVIVILIIVLNPFITINAGERGVLREFKAIKSVLEPGLHIIVPFVQDVIRIDVTIKKTLTDADASSKDLQRVNSTVALNYRIDPLKADIVYNNFRSRRYKDRTEVKERVIDPSIQEVVKAVTANYTAEELITKRPEVSVAMKESLTKRLSEHNVLVVQFSIVNFSFSKVFMEAIEAKQTAEQLAFKSKQDLVRIKIEAQQKIASAKAEAESLRLQKQNVTPDLVKLRQIEAAMKAIEKWDGHLPSVTAGAIPFIDVKSFGK